jgi:hypothetical protein
MSGCGQRDGCAIEGWYDRGEVGRQLRPDSIERAEVRIWPSPNATMASDPYAIVLSSPSWKGSPLKESTGPSMALRGSLEYDVAMTALHRFQANSYARLLGRLSEKSICRTQFAGGGGFVARFGSRCVDEVSKKHFFDVGKAFSNQPNRPSSLLTRARG